VKIYGGNAVVPYARAGCRCLGWRARMVVPHTYRRDAAALNGDDLGGLHRVCTGGARCDAKRSQIYPKGNFICWKPTENFAPDVAR